MTTRFLMGVILLVLAVANLMCQPAVAFDDVGAASDDVGAFEEYAKKVAESYEIRIGGAEGRRLTLCEKPILRWTNPVDTAKARGDVFLWVDEGRPTAAMSLYEFVNGAGAELEHHEFCSLAEESISARRASKDIWYPAEGGIDPKPISDAPAPADSARARFRQMRELAEGFTAEKTTYAGVTRRLRLLSQPVYRYDASHGEILDRALFAFVEGTDPDVFLLLEAQSVGEQVKWQFACAPMTGAALRVYEKEKVVWEAPLRTGRNVIDQPTKAYTPIEHARGRR